MKVGDLVMYFWDDLGDDDAKVWTVASIDGDWVKLLEEKDPDTFTFMNNLEVISESR